MKTRHVRPESTDTTHTAAAFISVKAAAELLSVSQVSIRRYLGQGQLKRFKCGSRTLLLRDDVMGLVREVLATEVATAK